MQAALRQLSHPGWDAKDSDTGHHVEIVRIDAPRGRDLGHMILRRNDGVELVPLFGADILQGLGQRHETLPDRDLRLGWFADKQWTCTIVYPVGADHRATERLNPGEVAPVSLVGEELNLAQP